MADIVLVHGAWQGASAWDLVVPILENAGHRVSRPVLSGLGTDAHRLTPEFDLETHIADVVETLETEHLRHVALVGHCYAGMIITGVAEKVPVWIDRLVYVNAFIPDNCQSTLDLMPLPVRQKLRLQAEADGAGWRLRASESLLDLWGLKPGQSRDFARAGLCDFSLHCFEEIAVLPTNAAAAMDRTYIAGDSEDYPARPIFEPHAARAKREKWRCYKLPAGHCCHVERPAELAKIIAKLAKLPPVAHEV